jgi:hypothetical protein
VDVEEREQTVAWLARHGYKFYLYAPKADPIPAPAMAGIVSGSSCGSTPKSREEMRRLGREVRHRAEPYELYDDFNDAARETLGRKLAFFDDLGIADLAILFDDMRGDSPDLAPRQIEIIHWARDRTAATRMIVCPTYYSDDPILDRVFGERPKGYVEQMGEDLDPAIEIFWTGEK